MRACSQRQTKMGARCLLDLVVDISDGSESELLSDSDESDDEVEESSR